MLFFYENVCEFFIDFKTDYYEFFPLKLEKKTSYVCLKENKEFVFLDYYYL